MAVVGYTVTISVLIGIIRLFIYLLNKFNGMSYQTAKYVQYTFLFCVFLAKYYLI